MYGLSKSYQEIANSGSKPICFDEIRNSQYSGNVGRHGNNVNKASRRRNIFRFKLTKCQQKSRFLYVIEVYSS